MMQGGVLRVLATDETAERLALGWWWVTAGNPPCAPWCDRIHSVDEFSSTGCLLCSRSVAIAPDFEVSVDQAQMGSEGAQGEITRTVDVVVKADDVKLDRIGALTRALRRAQVLGRGAVT